MAFIVGYRIDRREEQKVMKDKFDLLEDRLLQWGFSLNEEQKDKFSDYYDLLIEWKQVMNLTAITEFDEVSYSIYNRSQHALRFKKKINGITYITVAVISNKYQTFRIQTVYIDKDDFLKIYSKNTK